MATSVALTVTVLAGGSPVTTGTVTFYNGATSLGTGSLNSSGMASVSDDYAAIGNGLNHRRLWRNHELRSVDFCGRQYQRRGGDNDNRVEHTWQRSLWRQRDLNGYGALRCQSGNDWNSDLLQRSDFAGYCLAEFQRGGNIGDYNAAGGYGLDHSQLRGDHELRRFNFDGQQHQHWS